MAASAWQLSTSISAPGSSTAMEVDAGRAPAGGNAATALMDCAWQDAMSQEPGYSFNLRQGLVRFVLIRMLEVAPAEYIVR